MSSKDSRNAEKPAANGTGQTWDSLSSGIPADRRKFCLLASTYKKRVNHFFCVARDPDLCLQ